MSGLSTLQRFASPAVVEPTQERCELCSVAIGNVHRHVVDLDQQVLHCACHACAILFLRDDRGGGRFRTVPDRVVADPAFAMTATDWSVLGVPVGLAFFFRRQSLAEPMVCYPGPAGVTEAEPLPGLWTAVLAATPLAGMVEPDVEALLIHGERGQTQLACFIVPIDTAYALAGRLRSCWRGFTGGDEARAVIDTFFADLVERSTQIRGPR